MLLHMWHSTLMARVSKDSSEIRLRLGNNMKKFLGALTVSFVAAGFAGCQLPSAGPIRSLAIPAPAPVDPAVGNPCIEAAMAKYFIGPERVTLLGSSAQGGSTAVRMKADVRDAVCLVSAKGNVVSLTDTTPKSANQIAAEEAAAVAKAAGPAGETPKPVKKKKKAAKKTAEPAKAAEPAKVADPVKKT